MPNSEFQLLDLLRKLRHRARNSHASLVDDYKPFCPAKDYNFVRLPSTTKPSSATMKSTIKISVTPSCTAWMALALNASPQRAFTEVISASSFDKSSVLSAVHRILKEDWDTGGLDQNNPFTTSIVLRSIGSLLKHGIVERSDVDLMKREKEDKELPGRKNENTNIKDPWRRLNGKSLEAIVRQLLSTPTCAFALPPLLPTPSIAYWAIDAAELLGYAFEAHEVENLMKWATNEFRYQFSLVSARHQSMEDPIAMAMAACVCNALRRIKDANALETNLEDELLFPTQQELSAAIHRFFEYQNDHGVWEKYFPIFHYPNTGPNHCWHFEVLEAVISEFPAELRCEKNIARIDKSLAWLESNRLHFHIGDQSFRGWSSGGDIPALQQGEPESWPTGVAHMFLAKLDDVLSREIRDQVLVKYRDRVSIPQKRSKKKWQQYQDSVFLKDDLPPKLNSVKRMLEEEILIPAENNKYVFSPRPTMKLAKRRSAILFGPPGTSKTSVCEAISDRLGWPLLELSPSDFLGNGLEGIYEHVNAVFRDLMDLYGVVILFDEMDALVQSRDNDSKQIQLDTTQKFLTTSMLPKLSKLNKSARCIYFMATNHLEEFDPAISRSGRFDLLIHMGPATSSEKLEENLIYAWKTEDDKNRDDFKEVAAILKGHLTGDAEKAFDRFTFGEVGAFFDHLRAEEDNPCLLKAVKAYVAKGKILADEVRAWARSRITLSDETADNGALKRFREESKHTRRQ